ncbi:MAG: electron transfer flavoprotein subunit alpha/FixB family protein [Acidobacteria bacterium]|nr:electron transfer flavoprotein subunit alpha/FixB family protein [Acidobacteriota bacterium]
MPGKVYAIAEHWEGRLKNISWEAVAFGQQIADVWGGQVTALLLGSGIQPLAEELRQGDLAGVLVAEHQKLKPYNPDAYVAALRQIVQEDRPGYVVMAHSYRTIDFGPKLAAAFRKPLLANCVGLGPAEGGLRFLRPVFHNKLNAAVHLASDPPHFVSLQAGAVAADKARRGCPVPVVNRQVSLEQVEIRRKQVEIVEAVKGRVDLGKARIIVGVGRGIKNQESLKLVEDLALALGAEIGASRPIVDNEWLSRDRQIGSSGQTVTPRLYIACGISGAIQHLVGMQNSECIVAINKDPNAPIFSVATYGIVGDLFEVVPALAKKLREEQSE